MLRLFFCLALLAGLGGAAAAASPDSETPDSRITLQNHVFSPASVDIPAHRKIRLVIENRDAEAEEFDSSDLNREKVIPGNSTGFVFVGPLDPGSYAFEGEFHAAAAQGVLVAR